MPRKNLRSHLVSGSVAFAAFLISGAAWAQSGAAGSSTGATAATTAASTPGESAGAGLSMEGSATLALDATVSTSPLGLSPQSNGGQQSRKHRPSDSYEDAAIDGFVRSDGGLRFAPSFSTNTNTNATNFSARSAANGRSPGLTANAGDSFASGGASGNGHGRALGLNANADGSAGSGSAISPVAQGSASGIGNGSDNGLALGVNANLSFFATHVRSKGTTEVNDHDNGKAVGKGQAHGKKLGHANHPERFDESAVVPVVSSNPVISDAVAPTSSAAIIMAALPAVAVIPSAAAAAVNDLSSPSAALHAAPVPEPANWLLLALGLLVLAGRALTRRGTLLR